MRAAASMTDIDRRNMLRLYEDGASTLALAQRYGVSREFVSRTLAEFGLRLRPGRRRRPVPGAIRRRVLELSAEGASQLSIANRLGVTRALVRRVLTEER